MRPEEPPIEVDLARRLQQLERENAQLRAQLVALAPPALPAAAAVAAPASPSASPRVDRRRWVIAWAARVVLFALGLAVGAVVFRSERADFVRGFRDGVGKGAAARQQVRDLGGP